MQSIRSLARANTMTSKHPPITIIGGGLSGLTLGLALKRKNIQATIYERTEHAARYSYGITLYPSTYRPVLDMLGIDEATFRQKVAVDARANPATDEDAGISARPRAASDADSGFFCNRSRLEALLRHTLHVRWGRKLESINLPSASEELTATFTDGDGMTEVIDTAFIIGCDGQHSMTRRHLSPEMQLQVLPYVVFSGKREIPSAKYGEPVFRAVEDSLIAQGQFGSTRIEVSLNDISDTNAILRYVYSRPSHGSDDPLFNPKRDLSESKKSPKEFYIELSAFKDSRSLGQTLDDVFRSELMVEDRVLHWLMRCLEPDMCELRRLAKHRVVLIGDAAHTTPILGGNGANAAMLDALKLAEYISSFYPDRIEQMDLEHFVESNGKRWALCVHDSRERIKNMHLEDLSQL